MEFMVIYMKKWNTEEQKWNADDAEKKDKI
jgi:hypothetical protein